MDKMTWRDADDHGEPARDGVLGIAAEPNGREVFVLVAWLPHSRRWRILENAGEEHHTQDHFRLLRWAELPTEELNRSIRADRG